MAGIGLQMPKEVKIQTRPSISEAEPQAGGAGAGGGEWEASSAGSLLLPSIPPPSQLSRRPWGSGQLQAIITDMGQGARGRPGSVS